MPESSLRLHVVYSVLDGEVACDWKLNISVVWPGRGEAEAVDIVSFVAGGRSSGLSVFGGVEPLMSGDCEAPREK